MSRCTVSDQGHLVPWAADTGLADGGQNLPLGHLIFESIKFLILDEANRVVASDRTLQKAFGIIRECGRDHRQSRHVGVPVFWSVRVGRSHLQSRTRGATKNNRNRVLPPTHVPNRPRVVDDLVIRNHRKTPCHELHHRPQSLHGRSHTQPGKTRLTDWSI